MWSVSPAYLSFDVGSFGVPRESRSPAVLSFFWAGAMAFGWAIGAVVAAPDGDGGASFTRVSAEPGVFLLPSMSPPRWSWPGEPAPGVLPGALGVWALATVIPASRAPAAAMVINFFMGISSVFVERKGVLVFSRKRFRLYPSTTGNAQVCSRRALVCVPAGGNVDANWGNSPIVPVPVNFFAERLRKGGI